MYLEEARKRIEKLESDSNVTLHDVFINIVENKFRKSKGVETCHYVCYLGFQTEDEFGNDSVICQSGYYRQEVGDDETINSRAKSKLNFLGYELEPNYPGETSESKTHRSRYYMITNL